MDNSSNDNGELLDEVVVALRALVNRSFPKKCSCGRVYQNLEEFLAQTRSLNPETGLFQQAELSDKSIMNLLRHCACGSTLLAVFNERRDVSDKGVEIRELFDRVLQYLVDTGLVKEEARRLLLDLLHGRNAHLLQQLSTGHPSSSVDKLVTLVKSEPA
jgi:hypothetical protein